MKLSVSIYHNQFCWGRLDIRYGIWILLYRLAHSFSPLEKKSQNDFVGFNRHSYYWRDNRHEVKEDYYRWSEFCENPRNVSN